MNTIALVLIAAFGFGEPGTSVLPLLRVGQGPRASAMGEAGIGLADNATAIYWNPAGLGQLPNYHLALSHHQWFSDIKDELFYASIPAGPGAFGLSLVYSGESGIERWDENNQPIDTFRTWNSIAALGYGAQIAKDWHLGGAFKGFYQNLYTMNGYGGAVDLGLLARPFPFLSLGLAGRNLGRIRYGSDWETLPTEIGLGTNFHKTRFNASIDIVYPFDNSMNIRTGLEYAPVREFALRLGYRTGPADLATLGYLSGLTAGLGFRLGNFGADYCFTPYGKLGITHRIGIKLKIRHKGSGLLKLRVIDKKTTKPLWANLAFSGIRNLTTGTNRRGELELKRLLPGQLTIRTTSKGYQERTDTMEILGDRKQYATIALVRLTYGSIWGTIYDAETKRPVGGAITYQGPVYGEQTVVSDPGSFALKKLPPGNYFVKATGPTEDYIPQSCTLMVEQNLVTEHEFYLVKRRQTIVLQGINFETGKTDILSCFKTVLDRAGKILKQNPTIVVELAGHTDPREISTSEFPSNWELSQARAQAVRKYLIENFGIAPNRLVAHGYADTQPIATNDTKEGMAKNRRTEFRIIEQ